MHVGLSRIDEARPESAERVGDRLRADSADGQYRVDSNSDGRVALMQDPLRPFIVAAKHWSAEPDL
jgi:hypothetical protein